jgi:hypothetical protein
VSQLEIWAPGLEITIDGQGRGRYLKRLAGERGEFALTSEQFAKLIQRLEVFRRSGETIAAAKMRENGLNSFRCDEPYGTDQGGITFHWSGASLDQFYAVDYGCAPDKHAARNRELGAILSSLPVPEPESLP